MSRAVECRTLGHRLSDTQTKTDDSGETWVRGWCDRCGLWVVQKAVSADG